MTIGGVFTGGITTSPYTYDPTGPAPTPAPPTPTTVTWDNSNISDLHVNGTFQSYTKEGVTLSANANMNSAEWNDMGMEDGINFQMNESGGYTFTAPSGKKFTKIEMQTSDNQINNYWGNVANEGRLGTGWPSNSAQIMMNNGKITWEDTAASTVGLLTNANNFNSETAPVTSIVFTLADE